MHRSSKSSAEVRRYVAPPCSSSRQASSATPAIEDSTGAHNAHRYLCTRQGPRTRVCQPAQSTAQNIIPVLRCCTVALARLLGPGRRYASEVYQRERPSLISAVNSCRKAQRPSWRGRLLLTPWCSRDRRPSSSALIRTSSPDDQPHEQRQLHSFSCAIAIHSFLPRRRDIECRADSGAFQRHGE